MNLWFQQIKGAMEEQQVGSNMHEMTSGTIKMNETGAALSNISGKVASSVSEITEQIDQFNV